MRDETLILPVVLVIVVVVDVDGAVRAPNGQSAVARILRAKAEGSRVSAGSPSSYCCMSADGKISRKGALTAISLDIGHKLEASR